MKRLILLAFLLVAGYSAFAQDIITKKDGTDIKAKISEVGTTEHVCPVKVPDGLYKV